MPKTTSRSVTVQRTRNGYWQVIGDGHVYASYRGGDKAHMDAEARASKLRIHAAILDDHFPLRGPCGLCGSGEDQTHRILDSIADMARAHYEAGDLDASWVATEFGVAEEHSTAVTDAALAWTAYRPLTRDPKEASRG